MARSVRPSSSPASRARDRRAWKRRVGLVQRLRVLSWGLSHGKSRAVPAQLIDGKAVAKVLEGEVAAEIARLGIRPGLVAVRVGNDPASEIYVRNKARKARELGLEGTELVFPETMIEAELLAEVARLNA